jgi:hypothetical protein
LCNEYIVLREDFAVLFTSEDRLLAASNIQEALRRIQPELSLEPSELPPPGPDGSATAAVGTLGPAPRAEMTIQRIVRSSAVTEQVKEMYDHCCQVCGSRIQTRAGFYSEGAHIRPLGRPHDGDDVVHNVLCLCPNHHVQLDLGGLTIDPSSLVITGDGIPSGTTLRVLTATRLIGRSSPITRACFSDLPMTRSDESDRRIRVGNTQMTRREILDALESNTTFARDAAADLLRYLEHLPSVAEQAHVLHEVQRIQGYLGGILLQLVRALQADEG